MSELRDRIAAVITEGKIAGDGHGTIADAVIAELGPELTHQHCGWHDAEDCKCRCCNPDYYRAWLEDQGE